MKTIKNNTLLCEIPDWGCGWSRCEFIGFRMKDGYASPYLCLKYAEAQLQSTPDGWLERCEACANGGYSPRSTEEPQVAETSPVSRPRKPKPNLLPRDLQTMPKGLCLESQILWALESARGPVTKTQLLKVLSGLGYRGYIEYSFVSLTHNLGLAFDNLIDEDFINYIKGKAVELKY